MNIKSKMFATILHNYNYLKLYYSRIILVLSTPDGLRIIYNKFAMIIEDNKFRSFYRY